MKWGVVHKYRPEKIKWSFGFYTTATPVFLLRQKMLEKLVDGI